ncbi:uncharacterized protein J4E88_000471 [Alternaria novae-zelandiae]|uniref:uncharacterized protein n=1 Tax=Alternaria novae-zelandiae TaxID=430562 RepID=UPI0020C28912|nr:uncharacterized protein J4E88_000471 [Alternaria novae-zelandiae]KAI4696296.1 hypothetical protein J4E88_000471 [Alternaria novae-zelandiae]
MGTPPTSISSKPIASTSKSDKIRDYQTHSTINQDPNVITFTTQSPTILPMTDYNNQRIDAQDLTSRLASFENKSNNNNSTTKPNGDTASDSVLSQRRPRSTSIDSGIMPRFTKSATTSTTGTNDSQYSQYSGLRVMHAEPSSKTHAESVGVAPGEFSKPRVHKRSRRNTQSSVGSGRSAKSEEAKEFKYYGRHSNQWLFNDFSVTDAVSKGFKRVFSNNGSKDWYEDRNR